MKVVLSRKGFDSSNGRVPSPIFPDGRMLSLPIPARNDAFRLGDLRFGDVDVARLASALKARRGKSEFMDAATPVHLDPDIHAELVPRSLDWRPALGQSGAAQSHLANQGVNEGDLFLFYGWFREIEHREDSHAYRSGAADRHVIFGWLQVGSIWNINEQRDALLAKHPGVRQHPHLARLPKYEEKASNVLYVAADKLRVPGLPSLDLPGAGVFGRLASQRVLTAPGMSRRYWRLPGWFYNQGRPQLSYHLDPALWTDEGETALVRSAAIGQEFVLQSEDGDAMAQWLKGIFGMTP